MLSGVFQDKHYGVSLKKKKKWVKVLIKYKSKENGFLILVVSKEKWRMKETYAMFLHILQR